MLKLAQLSLLALLLGGCAPSGIAKRDCRYETAVPLTFGTFITDPDRYAGSCVRIGGVANARGFYATTRAANDREDEIALYSSDKFPAVRNIRGRGTLVGLATTCQIMEQQSRVSAAKKNAKLKAAGSDEIVVAMMTGPCHYNYSPVLRVHAWRPEKEEAEGQVQ